MEGIKQIALSVSVSAAVISAFYIICPDGNMSKQMKYIIGLLMLLAVLTPIQSGSRDESHRPACSGG